MHFTSFATVLLAFSVRVVTTFTVPRGLPNGVYKVEILPDGSEGNHTRLLPDADLPGTANPYYDPLAAHANTPRSDSLNDGRWEQAVCYTSEGLQDLDHATTDLANAGLDKLCGRGVDVGGHRYAIRECVVAYVCGESQCEARDRMRSSRIITEFCGLYKPGSVFDAFWGNRWGYESYCTAEGRNFCGMGV